MSKRTYLKDLIFILKNFRKIYKPNYWKIAKLLFIIWMFWHINTKINASYETVAAPVIAPVIGKLADPPSPPTPKPTQELTYRSGTDISKSKEATVKAINKFLKNKLKDKGNIIYEACKSQNPRVNSKLMTAIILTEVGGDCDSPLLNEADNVGGLNWTPNCGYPKRGWYMDFSKHGGVDASIKKKAYILSQYYIKEGRKDIIKIGLKYAPPNDSRNGIGGMDNNKWPTNVKYWYDLICEEASKL